MQNTYLKIIKFCLSKERCFKSKHIVEWLKLSSAEKKLLELNIYNAYIWNPNTIFIHEDHSVNLSEFEAPKINLSTKNKQQKSIAKCASDINTYYLTFEAISSYYDYLELKEARETSKKAFNFSITAIIISLTTLLISVYYSHKQINTPISIEEKQINEITKVDKDYNELLKVIDNENKKTTIFKKNIECLSMKEKIQKKLEDKKTKFWENIHVEQIFFSSQYSSCLYVEHTTIIDNWNKNMWKRYYNRRLFDVLNNSHSSDPIEACLLSDYEECKKLDEIIEELKKEANRMTQH